MSINSQVSRSSRSQRFYHHYHGVLRARKPAYLSIQITRKDFSA